MKVEITMGYLVLQGGSEFMGCMRMSDSRALALAGGTRARVSILPTAAAPDGNHQRAGKRGQDWFRTLGALRITVLPVIDRSSADDPHMAAQLEQSDLIYLLGGFPAFLAQTMANSSAWKAACNALKNGAVLAGSSAGAMVLCEHLFDPQHNSTINGLNLIPACCVIPHHDKFGHQWVALLQKKLPGITLLGIDEQTGAINDGANGGWTVYGGGAVTLYGSNGVARYEDGSVFSIQHQRNKD